jgi:antitoxin VapB
MERKARRNVNRVAPIALDRQKSAKAREGGSAGRDTEFKKASLFMNGRSQAVRLPKEFRFEGTHVYAKKDGNRVILSPVDDRIERLIALMGSSPDFPDVPRDAAEPMRPEIKEFFGVSD